MQPSRLALLGGPAFFALWFIGAQILYFAVGGTTDGGPLPGPSEYPDVVLSNESNVLGAATLLVLAAAALLWFATGLRVRIRSEQGVGLAAALAAAAVAVLLIVEAGHVVASVEIAREAPEVSWSFYRLSTTLGFESFITALLGAVATTAFVATTGRDAISKFLWWFTVLVAAALIIGGLLEGLGATPSGRFSIFFGLWALIAGFVLFAKPRPVGGT
jgi:hypothetical protein